MTKAWEFTSGTDTPKSFEAFSVYLHLGPSRSYRKVSQRLGKSETLINRWGSQGNWTERAANHDAEIQRLSLAGFMEKAAAAQATDIEQFRISAKNIATKQIQIIDALETLQRDELYTKTSSGLLEKKLKEDVDFSALKQIAAISQLKNSQAPWDILAKVLQIDGIQEQLNSLEVNHDE